MTLPPFIERWKYVIGITVPVVTYIAGSGGWFTVTPRDQFDDFRTAQAIQANAIEVQAAQLSEVARKVDFVTQLLCDGVLTDTVRSRGDRYLRQQCQQLSPPTSTSTQRASLGVPAAHPLSVTLLTAASAGWHPSWGGW